VLQNVCGAIRPRSRFSQVHEQYTKAPDVTRQRIYLETMERVLGGTDKTIIDTGGQSSPGVVPYLPLTSLPRERATQQQQAINEAESLRRSRQGSSFNVRPQS
jgi:modulator of FtsH protease HflK